VSRAKWSLLGTTKPTADPQRDEDLFNAARSGELDKLKELIANGADPSGYKKVRVIAEAGHAPPVRPRAIACRALGCRIASVEFASARVVWFGAASSRRRPNRRRRLNRPSRSSELL